MRRTLRGLMSAPTWSFWEYAPQALGIKRLPRVRLPALRIRFPRRPIPNSQDAPAGLSESWEIQSVGGRWCKAPVVSAGSSPGPRYRFRPYTAPHDNNTLRISAPAVAMTISRLPDLSANAAPPVLHPKRPYRGRFS